MAEQAELIKLYSTRILALAADVPHLGRLDNPSGTSKRRSPICGSQVTVDVQMDGDVIRDFAQDVKACALGQAAAAVTGSKIIGLTRDDAAKARDELAAMLAGDGTIPTAPFDDFVNLTPAIDYKNRHASIMLVLQATVDACDASIQ